MIIIQFDRRNQFFLDCCELHHVKIAREKIALSHRHSDWLNTPQRVVFSNLFSVLRYPDETLSLVFDISLNRLQNVSIEARLEFSIKYSHLYTEKVSVLTRFVFSE